MKCSTVKAAAVAIATGVVSYGFAGGGAQTFSLAPMGNAGGAAAQPAAADSGETVKVQGRGVGTDKMTALKDAYRDAIERAVGLYVDAEVAVANDQIIKKQILTQSNAYITDYKEIEEKRLDGGLVQLRILATVKKAALTTKLSGVMPTQTIALNTGLQNVHAQLATKEKRSEDAAALLKSALDGINPMKSLMIAGIRPETQKIITTDDAAMGKRGRRNQSGTMAAGSVVLRYIFEVKLDRAKYFAEFVPHLKKTLEQISLVQPKEIRLMELMPNSTGRNNMHLTGLNTYLEKGSETMGWDDMKSCVNLFGHGKLTLPYDFAAYLDPIHVYSINWQGRNWVWKFGRDEYRPKSGGAFSWSDVDLQCGDFKNEYRKDKVYFAMITQLSEDCANGKVTIYELDKSVIEVLNDWRATLVDMEKREQQTTNYNIVLLDKTGNELGVYPWQIPNAVLMNVKFAEIPGAGMVYAAPFVGCFGENLIQWRDFIIEQDQLAKIASAKIELAD